MAGRRAVVLAAAAAAVVAVSVILPIVLGGERVEGLGSLYRELPERLPVLYLYNSSRSVDMGLRALSSIFPELAGNCTWSGYGNMVYSTYRCGSTVLQVARDYNEIILYVEPGRFNETPCVLAARIASVIGGIAGYSYTLYTGAERVGETTHCHAVLVPTGIPEEKLGIDPAKYYSSITVSYTPGSPRIRIDVRLYLAEKTVYAEKPSPGEIEETILAEAGGGSLRITGYYYTVYYDRDKGVVEPAIIVTGEARGPPLIGGEKEFTAVIRYTRTP